ncbi:hypothetical protein CAPTEDRAFT_198688 [Capitella teleta]|uniref:NACHT domain-containing protein n=1 Tax=Capitella teleta TaxID=283909 RepID=R7V315_CAPTE|nr:hypothetical protein CAPTEDRAFT_198688 [Capitella teleta]|eukprot:ELU12887.1 hypothetical protein CAPTEDRAFT_198688 [Capitella teleta]
MDESHKELITTNLVTIMKDLDPSDIYSVLIAGGVLTLDDKDRISTTCPCRRDEAMELISVLLRKGPTAFGVLVDALQFTYPHLYDLLSVGVCTGEDKRVFEYMRSELQHHYKSRLRSICPMPWLQGIRLSLSDIYVERRLLLKTDRNSDGATVTMDNLFTPQETEEIPCRLLIEGTPGIGKSTICQTLAYEWGKQSCGNHCRSPCVHAFDLVLYLHAGHFRAHETVADAIKSHLLPKDCNIISRKIKEVIEAKTLLLIVDAYDEAHSDNTLLDQLIEGSLLRQKTLLLTSRHNFLQDKLKYFDTAFSVEGYDHQQQLEHVARFAKFKKIDTSLFESMLESDEEDTQLLSTRTGLYDLIHKIITRKASERMKLTATEVEDLHLRPLYKLAFDAHQRNEYVLREDDFKDVSCDAEKVCQVGYLAMEVIISRLQEDVRYAFTHRTFLEYLTAKHIALMDQEDRLNWLQDLRYTKYTIRLYTWGYDESFDFRQNEHVLGFLFGLLEDDPESLQQVASVVMDKTHFSEGDPILSLKDDSSCGPPHMLIRLICELHDMPPKLQEMMVKRCPARINIYLRCSARCRRGILFLGNSLRLPRPISLGVDLGYFNTQRISFIAELFKSKNIECSIISITPFNHTTPRNILTELKVGQVDSFRHVIIECGNDSIPSGEVLFGDDLGGLQLDRFGSQCTYRYMQAALGKPLTSISLVWCELDDKCSQLLCELLQNQHLRSVSLESLSHKLKPFLRHLAQLDKLQSCSIAQNEFTQEEGHSLEIILKKNTLDKLTIRYFDFWDCAAVLRDSFPCMTSLRELQLLCYGVPSNNNSILSHLHHLRLHRFTLEAKPTDEDLKALVKALQSWSNLQELKIEFIGFNHDSNTNPNERSLRLLFEAISGCQYLEFLCLKQLKIQDSVIPDVCRMIESLKQLRKFKLEFRNDEIFTQVGLKQLQSLLERKDIATECICWT